MMASYIAGPDPRDHKFECLFPDCGKRFGRKYNIQSHIQTHLSDRPYRCETCRAGFVGQHDLRRHEKIHGGDKPFVCACRKSFARQDALTRHRQRYRPQQYFRLLTVQRDLCWGIRGRQDTTDDNG
jgi:regulatory protein SWI5